MKKRAMPKVGAGRSGPVHTVKTLHKSQFKEKIENNARFHKENAMKWAAKQDWEALQDDFETPGKTNGTKHAAFRWSDIQTFAKYHADGDEDHERWLLKSIGPGPKKEIEWRGDWAAERTVKKVRDLQLTTTLEKQLQKDTGLFEIISRVAGGYRSWMEEPERMREAVVKFLGGSIIEDKPKKWHTMSAKERKAWRIRQSERLEFYSGWMNRIIDYKDKVDSAYLKTLGANKPTLPQVINNLVLARTNGNGQPAAIEPGSKEDSVNRLIAGLVGMEISKSQVFENPLPDDYQQAIETSAKEVKG